MHFYFPFRITISNFCRTRICIPPGSKYLESYPPGNFQKGFEIILATMVEPWDLKNL